MTIAIAWTRRIRDCEELVFASDSRLSRDGRIFDAAPKALTLSRNDCAIAFAGLTQDAFPMMLQFSLAVSSYGPARRRSIDLSELKTHALKIFDEMATLISSDAYVKGSPPDDVPAAQFLFGGYSWIKKEFELWKFKFDKTQKRFVSVEAEWAYLNPQRRGLNIGKLAKAERKKALGRIAFAGDQAPKARRLFSQEMVRRYRKDEAITKIDMEPFDILIDMLRDPEHSPTIGGAPQLIKVYQYMKAVSFPIYWPNKESGRFFLQGRPCVGYEHLDTKIVDPDNHSWPTSSADPLADESASAK
ncbi:MAG TPA: hypothetical protein VG267_06600 [Terracidiphilus sp.]|jgi:hypothetical protein|nr:hypothetical protein [Terracidiphilus sp.]